MNRGRLAGITHGSPAASPSIRRLLELSLVAMDDPPDKPVCAKTADRIPSHCSPLVVCLRGSKGDTAWWGLDNAGGGLANRVAFRRRFTADGFHAPPYQYSIHGLATTPSGGTLP
jgi:hypothetical protein